MVFLSETKLNEVEAERLKWFIGFECGVFVSCRGTGRARSGGLVLLWKRELSVQLLSFSFNHIDVVVDMNQKWRFTGVYGWPNTEDKGRTWEMLKSLKIQSLLPWYCCGDFNEILTNTEKRGDLAVSQRRLNQFFEAIQYCDLREVDQRGLEYTWWNGQEDDRSIESKLDRGFASLEWLDLFPASYITALPRIGSDHSPLSCTIREVQEEVVKRRFQFESMWLRHAEIKNQVAISWNKAAPGADFSSRTAVCADSLRQWENCVFGQIRSQKKQMEKQIAELQANHMSNENKEKLTACLKEREEVLAREECMWAQRSRIDWLKAGDRNTRYFHRKATHRRARNRIEEIHDEGGRVIREGSKIKEILRSFYVSLFTSTGCVQVNDITGMVGQKVTEEMNRSLLAPYTSEEIFQALQQMFPTKAPRPDEGLGSLLQSASNSGIIRGIKVARAAPSITHLFFADDSLLFGRANARELRTILELLKLYEEASGQKVNLQKSSIIFSSNTLPMEAESLRALLGVRMCSNDDKYLGFRTMIGRSKKELFSNLEESIRNKIGTWKTQYLSRAGRETLIKSVLQAIPSYVMSCFMIPLDTCSRIEKLLCDFFWGSTQGEKKMHWRCWDKMCRPKCAGGMGFRKMHIFNKAMLAKQVWRIMTNPDSMVAQILKARYFPRCSILQAGDGYNPSYLWQSLRAASSLLQDGVDWRLGSGNSLHIWTDRWLPQSVLGHPTYRYPGSDGFQLVSELIDEGTRTWKEDLLFQLFITEEVHLIRALYLSTCPSSDIIRWRFSADGEFTVKSCYHMGFESWWNSSTHASPTDCDNAIWKCLWNSWCPPRLKFLLWRAIDNNIPVRDNLIKRGVMIENLCPLCGQSGETSLHLFFKCSEATTMWNKLGVPPVPTITNTVAECLDVLLADCSPKEQGIRIGVCWGIWKYRNHLVFGDGAASVKGNEFQLMIMQAISLVTDYQRENNKNHRPTPTPDVRWIPPDEGHVKINSDAGLATQGGGRVAAIARDSRGQFIAGAINYFPHQSHPTLLEALGVKLGLELARQMNWTSIILESDCLPIVNALQSQRLNRSDLSPILEDCWLMSASFIDCKFTFVRRGGNQPAHLLTKEGWTQPGIAQLLSRPSESIIAALSFDANCTASSAS